MKKIFSLFKMIGIFAAVFLSLVDMIIVLSYLLDIDNKPNVSGMVIMVIIEIFLAFIYFALYRYYCGVAYEINIVDKTVLFTTHRKLIKKLTCDCKKIIVCEYKYIFIFNDDSKITYQYKFSAFDKTSDNVNLSMFPNAEVL